MKFHNLTARMMVYGVRSLIIVSISAFLLFFLSACSNPPNSEQEVSEQADFRRTVIYLQTNEGLMVPVMKLIPWQDGIAMNTLNQLVNTEENQLWAEKLGLKCVIPEGVTFTLSVMDESVANLNIQGLPDFASEETEKALVTAVVNTLVEFPTIDKVQLMFDGVIRDIACGTQVKEAITMLPLNEEPLPDNASEDSMVYNLTLYYPDLSGALHVPVTRHVSDAPDIELAMSELMRGPKNEALLNCFPEGTLVLSASINDDIATVNLSKEFLTLNSQELEKVAISCMQLTAQQFGEVPITTLEVQVEGTELRGLSKKDMQIPSYANEFIS